MVSSRDGLERGLHYDATPQCQPGSVPPPFLGPHCKINVYGLQGRDTLLVTHSTKYRVKMWFDIQYWPGSTFVLSGTLVRMRLNSRLPRWTVPRK